MNVVNAPGDAPRSAPVEAGAAVLWDAEVPDGPLLSLPLESLPELEPPSLEPDVAADGDGAG